MFTISSRGKVADTEIPSIPTPHLLELRPEGQRAQTDSCLSASPAEMQAEPLGTTLPPFTQL